LYRYYDFWDGNFSADRTKNVTSNLGSTTWSTPVTLLANTDPAPDVATYWSHGKYDVGANDTSVFAWPWINSTTLSPLLKVKMRTSTTGPWNTSYSYNFNTPNNAGKVFDVKVNSNGNTSVLYENLDSVNHLLYIATYN
jgi:hypothetical protein